MRACRHCVLRWRTLSDDKAVMLAFVRSRYTGRESEATVVFYRKGALPVVSAACAAPAAHAAYATQYVAQFRWKAISRVACSTRLKTYASDGVRLCRW